MQPLNLPKFTLLPAHMEVEAPPATLEPPTLLKTYKCHTVTATSPRGDPERGGGPWGADAGCGCRAGNAPTATGLPRGLDHK